jgi:endo-1,4-beta-xylanase
MRISRLVTAAALAAVAMWTLNLPAAAAPGTDDADIGGNSEHVRNPAEKSLRELAKRHNLRVGTAVDMAAFNNDTQYRERIATEFSAVTAENVMKWSELEPQRGVYNWGPADQLVESARQNHQLVHGHTLLWHNQLPTWLTQGVASGEITPDELRQLLRKHIIDVVTHFRGKVWHWDVVNEVIDDNAQLRDTLWLQNLGPSYIADSFRWAHEADPRVRLYINDYNVEGIGAKSNAYYALVQQLLADRVPIHGFGSQGHLDTRFGNYTAFQVKENLDRFADLGLETAMTEVDVRMPMPPDATKLNAQAQSYGALMLGCLVAKRCVMFTVWGYTDKYSWVPGFFTGQGAANLLDENFQPKFAYREVQAVLAYTR